MGAKEIPRRTVSTLQLSATGRRQNVRWIV